MRDAPIADNPDLFNAMLDYRYLQEFGRDVDSEPNERVQVILKIWEYQDQRAKLDQKRAGQKG